MATNKKTKSARRKALVARYKDPVYLKEHELFIRWNIFSAMQDRRFRPMDDELNNLLDDHIKHHVRIPIIGAEVLRTFMTPRKRPGRGPQAVTIREYKRQRNAVDAAEKASLERGKQPGGRPAKSVNMNSIVHSHSSAANMAVGNEFGISPKTLEKKRVRFRIRDEDP